MFSQPATYSAWRLPESNNGLQMLKLLMFRKIVVYNLSPAMTSSVWTIPESNTDLHKLKVLRFR